MEISKDKSKFSKVEEKPLQLELIEAEQYNALPAFFQAQIDYMCPPPDDFNSLEEYKRYLRKRISRLSAMWMGIYSGCFLGMSLIIWLAMFLCRGIILSLKS